MAYPATFPYLQLFSYYNTSIWRNERKSMMISSTPNRQQTKKRRMVKNIRLSYGSKCCFCSLGCPVGHAIPIASIHRKQFRHK